MGFFSDLKDDLSQAVNELMPEDSLGSASQKDKAAAEMRMASARERAQGQAFSLPNQTTAPQTISSQAVASVPEREPVRVPEQEIADDLDGDSGKGGKMDEVGSLEKELEIASLSKAADEGESAGMASEVPEDIASTPRQASDETSVLTESMIINGNIATEGSLDVRGSIVGNVEALGRLNITGIIQGNSQAAEILADGARVTGELRSEGSIKVGQSTVILGNIYASSAVIAGAVKGDIDVKGPIILDASAIVMGDIKSKSVQINNGAVVEGMCSQCYADINPSSFFEELKKMK